MSPAIECPTLSVQTEPNATVELFEVGTSIVYNTVTADASGDFSIHLPSNLLTNGSISLFVEAVDPAGNQSLCQQHADRDDRLRRVRLQRRQLFRRGPLQPRYHHLHRHTDQRMALVTGISSLTGLIAGVTITGTGIPAGTTIKTVNATAFSGTLTIGSASVTGIASTAGLFAGESVTGTGIPAGTTIKTVNSLTTITLSATRRPTVLKNTHRDHHHAVGNATVSGVPEPHCRPSGYGWLKDIGRPGESRSFLVYQWYSLRPVQRYPLPGRLRRRRLR